MIFFLVDFISSIHIHYYCGYPRGVSVSSSQWVTCQSVAGQHRDTEDKQPCSHTFVPEDNLERPYLSVIFLDCWKMLEQPGGIHACTGRTPCRKTPMLGFESGPSGCETTVLPPGPLLLFKKKNFSVIFIDIITIYSGVIGQRLTRI